MQALTLNLFCFLLSGVFFEIKTLSSAPTESFSSSLLNVMYGAISLYVILYVLHLLTHSPSIISINTLYNWKNYVILHVMHLFVYKFTVDLSIFMNVNSRSGIALPVAIIGNAVFHILFIAIISFWGIKSNFPQTISLAKKSVFQLFSILWLFIAIVSLCQNEVCDYFSFLLICYTTLSASVSSGEKKHSEHK